MSEELKCCPFCGSDEVEVCRTNPLACWIRCAKCGADAESDKTREGAIANWNRRVESEGIFAKIISDDDKEQGTKLVMLDDILELAKDHWTPITDIKSKLAYSADAIDTGIGFLTTYGFLLICPGEVMTTEMGMELLKLNEVL